jgi:hypothetical protein
MVGVHPDGLWLTWAWIEQRTFPEPSHAIWWSPRLPHATVAPLGLAWIWCRLHLFLAALWHDLCAHATEVVIIEHPLGSGPTMRYQTRFALGAGSQMRQHAGHITQAGTVIASASPFW